MKYLIRLILRKCLGHKTALKQLSNSELKIYYPRGQHLNFLLKKTISYEPEIIDILLELKENRKISMIFDIGANIGQSMLNFHEIFGHDCRIVCLEPDENSYEFLKKNVVENNLDNVQIVQKAIGDKNGEVGLIQDNVTGGRISKTVQYPTSQCIRVKETTIEALIEYYGVPELIKIDTEGCERAVLNGVKNVRTRRDLTYIIEVRADTKKDIYKILGHLDCYCIETQKQITDEAMLPDFCNLLFSDQSFWSNAS